ncbi:MAG TPA: polysaccharide deacetylase family protein, partial [Anaerolineae bacterium]|nr:polysaccharide deacetylase family protein [Anaerolineae bacterium]
TQINVPTSPTIESSPTIPASPTTSPSSPVLESLPTSLSSPIATPTSPAPLAPVLVSRPTGVFNVPILMYHYLSTPPAGADAIRMDLSVPPDLFESHLAYLREAGYQSLSFKQLAQTTSQSEALPPKPIIITFDDGYRDNYQYAFPLLQKYGFTATFFIFTQPIDTANVDYLSWDMVQEMHQAGMEFGSHSHTHPDLRHRSSEFLASEIVTSKQLIEQNIGEPIYAFAYPSGRYDDAAVEAVKSAGFLMAVTTEWGGRQTYDHRFVMPRVRVRGNDTAAMLAEKLKLVE